MIDIEFCGTLPRPFPFPPVLTRLPALDVRLLLPARVR